MRVAEHSERGVIFKRCCLCNNSLACTVATNNVAWPLTDTQYSLLALFELWFFATVAHVPFAAGYLTLRPFPMFPLRFSALHKGHRTKIELTDLLLFIYLLAINFNY